MKELENLLNKNSNLSIDTLEKSVKANLIHFEFTGSDSDEINIPVCGETRKDKITTTNYKEFLYYLGSKSEITSCYDCLKILKAISKLDEITHKNVCNCVMEFSRGPFKNSETGNKGKVPLPEGTGKNRFPIEDCCNDDFPEERLVPLHEQIFGKNMETFWANVVSHSKKEVLEDGSIGIEETMFEIVKDLKVEFIKV